MPWQPAQIQDQKPENITSHAQELQSLDEALHMSAHIRLKGLIQLQSMDEVLRRAGSRYAH
jgi:hypothetical protein